MDYWITSFIGILLGIIIALLGVLSVSSQLSVYDKKGNMIEEAVIITQSKCMYIKGLLPESENIYVCTQFLFRGFHRG